MQFISSINFPFSSLPSMPSFPSSSKKDGSKSKPKLDMKHTRSSFSNDDEKIQSLVDLRTYHIFLSHKKIEAQIFARYIKMILKLYYNDLNIFYDADNLFDLKTLPGIIDNSIEKANNYEMLIIIILTKEYLNSYWCQLELYKFYSNSQNTKKIFLLVYFYII